MDCLSNKTLASLPAAIIRPAYDRSAITPGIVHLGVGAFHRAHQAIFIDDALACGATNLGIIAASLRSPDTRDALEPQDCLYTVAFQKDETTTLRVIGSLLEVIVAPEDPERLLAALADPRIRLVTLTITEKAYAIDPATGRLDTKEPAIAADLAEPGKVTSALTFLKEAINRRRQAGTAPFTILPCDNLSKNGHALRSVLVEYAGLRDPALAGYISRSVPFCSSMVDRIVPATTEADKKAVAAKLGVNDAWPVTCEPDFAWIVEGEFPFDKALFIPSGVHFVDDVLPYEQMKLRLLNGSHTAIAALGRLAGFATVPEAVANPFVAAFLHAYWREALQTVSIDASEALAYQKALLPRYANSALPHKTAQIATDASQKLPPRILSPLSELLGIGIKPQAMIMAVALWMRSSGGIDDAGQHFEIRDPLYERWAEKPDQEHLATDVVVDRFLTFSAVFGPILPNNNDFVAALKSMLADLNAHGTLATLKARFAEQI